MLKANFFCKLKFTSCVSDFCIRFNTSLTLFATATWQWSECSYSLRQLVVAVFQSHRRKSWQWYNYRGATAIANKPQATDQAAHQSSATFKLPNLESTNYGLRDSRVHTFFSCLLLSHDRGRITNISRTCRRRLVSLPCSTPYRCQLELSRRVL